MPRRLQPAVTQHMECLGIVSPNHACRPRLLAERMPARFVTTSDAYYVA